MFQRMIVEDQLGQERESRIGEFPNFGVSTQAADSNQVIPIAAFQLGIYQRSGMTAGRSDTTPSAAAIIAANPAMNVGESFIVIVSVTVAFALTLVAGAGVTLAGKATIPASGFGVLLVTKTGDTTVTINNL